MGFLYLAVIATALTCLFIERASIPRVSDALAAEVILGDDPALPPVFAHRGGVLSSSENIITAIREVKRNGASGVELNVTITRVGVAVLLCDRTFDRTWYGDKGASVHSRGQHLDDDVGSESQEQRRPNLHEPDEPTSTLQEGVQECLRLGLRLILNVEEFDPRALVAILEVFTERPELHRRALVASPSPWFLFLLRRRDPGIVTALSQRGYSLAYKDMECTQARFQSLPAHWFAKTVDWLLVVTLRDGLFLHVTGASAVMVNRNALSADSVHTWRAQGLHVIAWAPNHTIETDFLRKVLKVPIVTDVMRQT